MRLTENNAFSARYEVLRNNAVYAELYAMDNSVEIQNSEFEIDRECAGIRTDFDAWRRGLRVPHHLVPRIAFAE